MPIHEWPDSWIDAWVEAERRRLLRPLEDCERSRQPTTATDILGRRSLTAFDGLAKLNVGGAFGVTTAPEGRTPQLYRDEIEEHLEECRKGLAGAEFEAALAVRPPVVWRVKNLTEHNLTDVKVNIHVDGDIEAFEAEDMPSLRSRIGAALRLWGPTTSSKFSAASLLQPNIYPRPQMGLPGFSPPKPEITNGGSFEIDFPSVSQSPSRRSSRTRGSRRDPWINVCGAPLHMDSNRYEHLWFDRGHLRHAHS